MALNPFAKEFVPVPSTSGVVSGLSSLKLKPEGEHGHNKTGDECPPVGDQMQKARSRNLHGGVDIAAVEKPSPRKPPRPPKESQQSSVSIPGKKMSTPPSGDMEFDDLFNQSPGSSSSNPSSLAAERLSCEEASRKQQLMQDVQDHQELHHVVPPNRHKGSPSMVGLRDEQDLLDTVDRVFLRTEQDVQDIKDAISVPEGEIQDNELEKDVVPRAAGHVADGEDPDDIEEEVQLGQSIRRQGSIFPDGFQQAEEEGSSTTRRLSPQDFEMHTVLGQGAFGKVFLVSKRDTGELFAMKVMRKDRILEKDHGAYVSAEREVLTAVVHPYIVTLQYSFQTSSKLYLMLDFINGGHLFFQLYREGIFSEDLARLYCAEIVLAISHLHNCGFVHRDLKPENILLDSEGHVKITDFGLSKKNIDDETRTNSFIGTMEYMAPEVINGTGHGKSVDWWSVGILLYEMLAGMPPFRAKSQQALKKQITSGKLKFPTYLSSQSLSILKGFLTRDPKKRLGYGSHGAENVMKHTFFKTIDWDKLFKREVKSPFRPAVKSSRSVENFDKIWTDLPPIDSPCATPDFAGLNEAFKDFSYYGQDERNLLARTGSHEGPRHLFDPNAIEKPNV